MLVVIITIIIFVIVKNSLLYYNEFQLYHSLYLPGNSYNNAGWIYAVFES